MLDEIKNDYGTLIAKKSERLVTALYLVTDLINDNEPIKNSLRDSSVRLLSSMNSLSQLDVKDRVKEFKNSLKSVTEILSLLHVSSTAGVVSDMNGSILIEGFRSLQLVLEKKQPILKKEMLLVDNEDRLNEETSLANAITSTSYDVITPLSLARVDNSSETSIYHGHKNIEDKKSTHSKVYDIDTQKENLNKTSNDIKGLKTKINPKDNIKDTYIEKNHSNIRLRPVASFITSFQMRKNSRKDQILALFTKGVDISIKDISARIKGCSEKTIQRELNTLVFDGVIERIGEKRWSRYILR